MTKLIFQFSGIVISFFVMWFLLSQFSWMDILNVHEVTNKTEDKIGALYIDLIKQNETIIDIDSLSQPIIAIIDQIKKANDIDTDIKLHIINKDEVNAFAIPNDHLILFSGLINDCLSPEELGGVIGHEIAHMEHNHVMKKLIKEVGLSVIVSMASGGNGTVVQESLKELTSSAYDRKLEAEADLTSVKYLKKANIDFRPFATFLFRLSLEESDIHRHMQLLSTHPASEERAKSILKNNETYIGNTRPLMSDKKWKSLQNDFQVQLGY